MDHCIFCKIVAKQISSQFVAENDHCFAFYDLSPKAPVHVLVVPKKHIESLSHAEKDDTLLLGECMQFTRYIATELKLNQQGYRVVTNIGEHGGQSVLHIHFHVLGGRNFTWPPG